MFEGDSDVLFFDQDHWNDQKSGIDSEPDVVVEQSHPAAKMA